MTISTDRFELPIEYGRLHDFTPGALAGFTSAVSLHAHTRHSSESLISVPSYLDRIPVVAGLFHRETQAYLERNGCQVDFGKGWWHPPLTPVEVLTSEAAQITQTLHLDPMVSITDHDSITGGLELQAGVGAGRGLISLEWTVPLGHGYLHLGVHNLRPADARTQFAALQAFTQSPDPVRLPALLDQVSADPGVLVVLNHPLWDLANVGVPAHLATLHRFLRDHRLRVHALELNGYRSWRENRNVCLLAQTWRLPVISGGDRHGRAPNTLLNLTRARTFADFARQVREDRQSDVLIMPDYRKPLTARKLAVAADVMRPSHSGVCAQQWMDRVTCEIEGTVLPLSAHWPGGGPLWVRSAIRAFRCVTSPLVLPLIGAVLTLAQGYPSGPASLSDVNAPVSSARELGDEVTR